MYAAGQKLWYVPHGRRSVNEADGYEITIAKVGRKWLSIEESHHSNLRLAVDSLLADGRGYSSPGKAYVTQQAYLDEKSRSTAWDDLRALTDRQYRVPDHLSTDDIRSAIAKLSAPKP